MFTRWFCVLLLAGGLVVSGVSVMPTDAAPSVPPRPQAVRCIPGTLICSGATVQNYSSVQFGVIGEDIYTRRSVNRILAQAQNSFDDLRIVDADFIYSTTYRIFDFNTDTVHEPGTLVKVRDLRNVVANDTVYENEFAILIYNNR